MSAVAMRPGTMRGKAAGLLEKAMKWAVPLGLGLFLAPFWVLLFYSPPATDDFCKATLSFAAVPQPGVLAVTWLYYTKWSPRWLTTLLQSFVMSRVNLASDYGWLLAAVMLATLAALAYFFWAVLGFGRRSAVLAASIFYAAWLAGSIQPATNVYWLTGAMEYQLPLCTSLLLIGVLYRYTGAYWQKILLTLFAVSVPAEHEIGGAFVCAVLIGGCVLQRLQRKPALHWCAAAGAAVASLAVVLLSPGNAVRAAAEHRTLWDSAHAIWWVKHAFFYKGLDWILRPGILMAGCCIAMLARPNQALERRIPGRRFGLVCVCALGVLLVEFAFLEITTGAELPGRVVGWFQFAFWLLMVCIISTSVPELSHYRVSIGSAVGVGVLLGLALFGSANFRDAIAEIRGPAQLWWHGNMARLSERGTALDFPDIHYPQIGQLTMRQPVTADSGCWVNQCVANYLHARTVVARGSTETCPH